MRNFLFNKLTCLSLKKFMKQLFIGVGPLVFFVHSGVFQPTGHRDRNNETIMGILNVTPTTLHWIKSLL